MYYIIGADGREYGPVDAEQIRRWLTEGRINTQTNTRADGTTDWKPLGALPEFSTRSQTPPLVVPCESFRSQKSNGMAVAGFVLGILSIFQCCSLLLGPLGIIFSSIGISQIKKRPTEFPDKGLAVAGLVLSILGTVINMIILIVYWSAILMMMDTVRK
ncbi:MAG: DUF4190 domain-containing protein [Verrucomicrobiota bacterium]